MKMLRAHILWGVIVPVVGTLIVMNGAWIGMIFLPKWYGVDPLFMRSVGITLVTTMLLGTIYKYCAVVSEMEI